VTGVTSYSMQHCSSLLFTCSSQLFTCSITV
jgi:hypothetical protein